MYIQPQPTLLNPHRLSALLQTPQQPLANALGVGVLESAVGHHEAFDVAGAEGAERDVVGLR